MSTEVEPLGGREAFRRAHGSLILRGVELVYLTEELYLRLFTLTLALTVVGALLSIWFGAVTIGASVALAIPIAGLALAGSVFALTHKTSCYLWLRARRWRQLSPALFCVVAVLCNGPDSPSWWVALPVLWVIAAVSSTALSVTAAGLTALAFTAGTLLAGGALIHNGEAGVLAAAVALPTNILIGRLVAEVFARFVLKLHQLELSLSAAGPAVHVENLAAPPSPAPQAGPRPPKRSKRDPLTRLTSRELEVLLLVRDGLHHSEIGQALGVSERQVERLLASARRHTRSDTTSQLIARLVSESLTP